MQIYLPSRRKSSVYSCCDTFDKGFTATPTNVCRLSTSLRVATSDLPFYSNWETF